MSYVRKIKNMSEKELRKELQDCRNELCMLCGRYKDSHLGACDSCRWKPED